MSEFVPVLDKNYCHVGEVNLNAGYAISNNGWLYQRLTKISDGRYVLVCISYLCCDRNVAYIVTPSEALTLILESDHEELLDAEEFLDLEFQVRNSLVINKPFDIVPQVMFD